MIIAITGTPGTGKSSITGYLSRITGWEKIGLNQLAEEKNLYLGHDKARKCKIVDLGRIENEVEKRKVLGKPLIIESHYAHDISAEKN